MLTTFLISLLERPSTPWSFCFLVPRQVNSMLLMTLSSPKVPQFPSNLFISVVDDNGGFVFHYSLRVPQLLSNLINVVDLMCIECFRYL